MSATDVRRLQIDDDVAFLARLADAITRPAMPNLDVVTIAQRDFVTRLDRGAELRAIIERLRELA